MSRLARGESEAGFLVNMAGSTQHAVGPQCDLGVSNIARKAHAVVDQPRAQTQRARLRSDQEQADTRDVGLIILPGCSKASSL